LAAENLLVRRQGRGTFVATHQEAKIRFRFLSMQANSGKEFKTSSRILNVETIVAPDGVRESFALKKKDKVVQIMRLLSFNDDAAVFEQIYLPFEIFTDVTAAKLTNYKGTLYGWFEAEYNVRMIRAVEKIRAVNAPEQATELLGIDEKQALLFVERISYTYADKPVEVRHGWYLTQDYFYQNELI
jgi:GntR family transcriptional regulator